MLFYSVYFLPTAKVLRNVNFEFFHNLCERQFQKCQKMLERNTQILSVFRSLLYSRFVVVVGFWNCSWPNCWPTLIVVEIHYKRSRSGESARTKTKYENIKIKLIFLYSHGIGFSIISLCLYWNHTMKKKYGLFILVSIIKRLPWFSFLCLILLELWRCVDHKSNF